MDFRCNRNVPDQKRIAVAAGVAAGLTTRILLEHFIADQKRFPGSKQDFTLFLTGDQAIRQAIPALKQLLESDSPEMRKEAALALRIIAAKPR